MARRGKKQTPPVGSRKLMQKRKELCPVRKDDHNAVFAGTWKDPNQEPLSEARDSFVADQGTARYDILYDNGVTERRSNDSQFTNPLASRTTYHYTADDLVGQDHLTTEATTNPTITRQSFWDSPNTFNDIPHNNREVAAYQRPSQYSTTDPSDPTPTQPTPRDYSCTSETLEDSFHVFQPSKKQHDSGAFDDGVEEITVLRRTTKVYRVRRQNGNAQQFYDEPRKDNMKPSFEDNYPANTPDSGWQYSDEHTYAQQYHDSTFMSRTSGNQDIVPVQQQNTQPYSSSFHGWVEEIEEDDYNHQHQQHLSSPREIQRIGHQPSNMEVVRYKGKRRHNEFDSDNDGQGYDEFTDTAAQCGRPMRKVKRLAY